MGADEMAELRRRILFCVVTLAINQSALGQADLEITLEQGLVARRGPNTGSAAEAPDYVQSVALDLYQIDRRR